MIMKQFRNNCTEFISFSTVYETVEKQLGINWVTISKQ